MKQIFIIVGTTGSEVGTAVKKRRHVRVVHRSLLKRALTVSEGASAAKENSVSIQSNRREIIASSSS